MSGTAHDEFGLSRVLDGYFRRGDKEKWELCVGVACELVNSQAKGGGKPHHDAISILAGC